MNYFNFCMLYALMIEYFCLAWIVKSYTVARMTKPDIKQYLEKIYDAPVAAVRTEVREVRQNGVFYSHASQKCRFTLLPSSRGFKVIPGYIRITQHLLLLKWT